MSRIRLFLIIFAALGVEGLFPGVQGLKPKFARQRGEGCAQDRKAEPQRQGQARPWLRPAQILSLSHGGKGSQPGW